MNRWTAKDYTNDITGEVRTVHRRIISETDNTYIYIEVYQLGQRLYWSANITVAYRPDLTRVAYGTYAAIPGALSVAKGRASRIALAALRASKRSRRIVRAA